MLTNNELDEKLKTRPAPRVTPEEIQARIANVTFTPVGETVTICSIELDNGYSVRGESACVNRANFDREVGEKISYDNAFRQLWPLFGFLLAERQFIKSTDTAKTLAGE